MTSILSMLHNKCSHESISGPLLPQGDETATAGVTRYPLVPLRDTLEHVPAHACDVHVRLCSRWAMFMEAPRMVAAAAAGAGVSE